MKKVDMSSEAITRRLRQTDQLRELSLSLMKAKKDSDEKKKNAQQTNAKSEIKHEQTNHDSVSGNGLGRGEL